MDDGRVVKLREVLVGGLIFVVGLGFIGELVFRKWRIKPRVVIIDPDNTSVRVTQMGDRWVWIERQSESSPGDPGRWNLPCLEQPDARRIMLFGDSIFFGSELRTPESLGAQLQHVLAELRPEESWCVMNFAQPGATLGPQLAFFEDNLPALRPQDLVVFELWYGSPREPVRLGERIYYLDGKQTDELGYPLFLGGLSGPLHRWLFVSSRFWEYLTFALSPSCVQCEPDWQRLVDVQLGPAIEAARAQQVPVMLSFMPPLDHSFPDLVADPVPWYDPVLDYVKTQQIPWVRAESLLVDEDVNALRLDSFCHYNALGTRTLAEKLAPKLLDATR